ncbi:hypothetical protein F4703DRAFT_1849189 [Phycomyces blakesleeanus]
MWDLHRKKPSNNMSTFFSLFLCILIISPTPIKSKYLCYILFYEQIIGILIHEYQVNLKLLFFFIINFKTIY